MKGREIGRGRFGKITVKGREVGKGLDVEQGSRKESNFLNILPSGIGGKAGTWTEYQNNQQTNNTTL